MLHTFILSSDGLPMDLPSAKSALIVRIDRSSQADEKSTRTFTLSPLLLVLTDPTEEQFDEADAAVAKDFTSSAGALLGRSRAFSQQLVQLWTPMSERQQATDELTAEEVSRGADPYDIDALPVDVLGASAPILLALDSLQVVQFPRGEMSRRDQLTLVRSSSDPSPA